MGGRAESFLAPTAWSSRGAAAAAAAAWLVLEELGQEWVPVESSWRLNERHYGALISLNREKMTLNHGEEQVTLWRRSYNVTPPPIEESHPYFCDIYNDQWYKDKTILKHLEDISDEDIINITLPTGVLILLELDENLRAVGPHQFLGDQEAIQAAIKKVDDQGKAVFLNCNLWILELPHFSMALGPTFWRAGSPAPPTSEDCVVREILQDAAIRLIPAPGGNEASISTALGRRRTVREMLQREMAREFLAESMSTYVMMVFGLGSVAHMVLGEQKFGSYLGVNLGFGFGVTMGVHVAGGISGAHMNAAVTFATCAIGRMPWKKFPIYVLGQFLGSFSAAATIYLLFHSAIDRYAGGDLLVTGPRSTAGIFATYLPEHMTLWLGFVDEVFVTGILQLCLLAITDKKNSPALPGTEALEIGILICVIGVSLGMNSGYAINPSRDLPPRFFTFIAGWGNQVFRAGNNWWWVPVVAPILGAYLGGIVYLGLIHASIPQDPQRLENSTTGSRKIAESPKVPLTTVSSTPISSQPAPPLSSSAEHF
ncbi:aquaporin-7 [Sigmodon hispidus]